MVLLGGWLRWARKCAQTNGGEDVFDLVFAIFGCGLRGCWCHAGPVQREDEEEEVLTSDVVDALALFGSLFSLIVFSLNHKGSLWSCA